MRKTIAVILVAAGQGTRAQGALVGAPKQYRDLAGMPVIIRSFNAFAQRTDVDWIVPVISPEHADIYADMDLSADALLAPVSGGATRQASVLAGLEALEPYAPDLVLIHDAARPLVSAQVIDNVTGGLSDALAVLPVTPVIDTIKRSAQGQIANGTEDRSALWAAQTPQGFVFADILSAHRAAAQTEESFTDDAAIAEWAGITAHLVKGDPHNIKVTRPEDFGLGAYFLGERTIMETRTGTGLDVHRFVAGDHVRLAEVDIAHIAKLSGHSDADAALHVLTDALLGALAEGDIGTHFPPSDEKWKGAPSRTFLSFAAERVATRGGRIVHLDLTLMCEAPKIGPHARQMRENIAAICQIDVSRVSVKAGTAEKMGFVGRGEGLFAQGTATVELPRGDQ